MAGIEERLGVMVDCIDAITDDGDDLNLTILEHGHDLRERFWVEETDDEAFRANTRIVRRFTQTLWKVFSELGYSEDEQIDLAHAYVMKLFVSKPYDISWAPLSKRT
jgi:hypothetical protein